MKKSFAIGILELMLVLSIIAIAILGVTNYYMLTKRNHLILETVNQIMRLNISIQDWKGKKVDYKDLSIKALATLGAFNQSEYDSTNQTLYSPFNTPINILPMLGNTHYGIVISALPSWACNNLVSKFKPNDATGNYNVECIINSFIYLGK